MIKYYLNKKIPNITAVTLNEGKDVDVWLKEGGVRTLAIGIGPHKNMTRRKLILLFRQIVATAKRNKIKSLELDVKDFRYDTVPLTPPELGELMSVNFEMANYDFSAYKTVDLDSQTRVAEIVLTGAGAGVEAGVKRGTIIGNEV